MFKSGFVSIIGRPNAGKSTLLNRLIGSKVAIVADKPQTTRTSIQGVLTLAGAQVVFVDTPGIHKPDTSFNRRMMTAVRTAVEDRDLLLYLVDASAPFEPAEQEALELIGKTTAPVFLLLNKVDALKEKALLLPLIERYGALGSFEEFFPISALRGQGIEELKSAIVAKLPEGPRYFPKDYLTDQPERFLAAELIREKILHLTRQEVPHSVAVLIDQFEESPRITRISATVYVEREGQKGILIGAKGSMLKRVGTSARHEMETLLGRKIFLELFVKVRPKWRESPEFLNAIDWRSMAGSEEN
jgi:GTP-binding protein Era